MGKVATATLLAWTLWWTQEQVGEPEKYRLLSTLRPLSVHDNQTACEAAAEKARVSQADLYSQSLASFGWKKFPSYMQRSNTFTCKSA
ncbi:MAG TPA: hypothetical protein VGT00_18850 [Methylomirabilota bacterium]|jgi:hypothetical protein|nr:hypothetical protein [Methylomirabilota bacterium]